ncbi:MAG: hypothetical protein K0R01_3539, partial [Mycobacterium sp.]|nr:hypothetical protein [Mycobacterium sp.]
GYRPVGIDDEGNLPPRARQAIAESAEVVTAIAGSAGVVLIYASGAYPARPEGAVRAVYIGPVQPATWLPNDEWVNNA